MLSTRIGHIQMVLCILLLIVLLVIISECLNKPLSILGIYLFLKWKMSAIFFTTFHLLSYFALLRNYFARIIIAIPLSQGLFLDLNSWIRKEEHKLNCTWKYLMESKYKCNLLVPEMQNVYYLYGKCRVN